MCKDPQAFLTLSQRHRFVQAPMYDIRYMGEQHKRTCKMFENRSADKDFAKA